MPLYEYRCKDCGHQFEKIQSFSAPDEKECPVCHGPVERLISASAVQFKGSGWYATDYAAKKSGPMKASADGESKPSAAKSADKPAASSADSGNSSSSPSKTSSSSSD